MALRVWKPVAFLVCELDGSIAEQTDLVEEMAWSMPMEGPSRSPIVVWPWPYVPDALRGYVDDPNDVDWVAFVPHGYDPALIPWLQVPAFGSCRVKEYGISGGLLLVAHHA